MRDLTCPFCGGPASVVMAGADLPRRWVSCADRRGCGAGGPYSDSAEEAIEAFCGVARDAKLGAMVRESVGLWASDPGQIAWSEEIHVYDEGEPDKARLVIIVSDEQVEILGAVADAFREEEEVPRG